MLYADHYVGYFGIEPRGTDETETEYIQRVAKVLRAHGRIIDAHEVVTNSRYETSETVIDGVIGHIVKALNPTENQNLRGENDPIRALGDEVALGHVYMNYENPLANISSEELMLLMMLKSR